MFAPSNDDVMARERGFKDYNSMKNFYAAQQANRGAAVVIPGATPPAELARQQALRQQQQQQQGGGWLSALSRISEALSR